MKTYKVTVCCDGYSLIDVLIDADSIKEAQIEAISKMSNINDIKDFSVEEIQSLERGDWVDEEIVDDDE